MLKGTDKKLVKYIDGPMRTISTAMHADSRLQDVNCTPPLQNVGCSDGFEYNSLIVIRRTSDHNR